MALVTNNQTHFFDEVIPDAVAVKGVSRSSILTQRRRCRVAPQTGIRYGANGAGGGGQQLQFLISDSGGLLDPSSISIMYNIQTTTTAGVAAADDLAPFTRLQINLNGQNLEDITNASRAANAELRLNATEGWYKTAGSFCGTELLNNELLPGGANVPASVADVLAYSGAWGNVVNNLPSIAARQTAVASTINPYGGESRIVPLGLYSGLGRMKNYLPLNVLGELNIVAFTAPANEALVGNAAAANADYSLNGVFIEYDIVIPHPAYAELLHKVANDPMEAGLYLPFESTIVAAGGTVASSAGSLSETSIIVSRATQNLLRSYLIQQPTALVNSIYYPSYSCFGHAGMFSIQFRIGSTYHPQVPAEGDASMFAMTQLAYGTAARNDAAGVVSRVLWNQFTSTQAAGVLAPQAGEGSLKFCGADSFVPCYGYNMVKGSAGEIDIDGIALSGASGAQCVCVIRSAPAVAMTPLVGLVALRFINAQGGAVRVVGA
jgi:hypothetical protein